MEVLVLSDIGLASALCGMLTPSILEIKTSCRKTALGKRALFVIVFATRIHRTVDKIARGDVVYCHSPIVWHMRDGGGSMNALEQLLILHDLSLTCWSWPVFLRPTSIVTKASRGQTR